MRKSIAGAGGGKAPKQRTPVESPDSLHAVASAQILDLISEGEIKGFAHPENILRDVYLDETPIANPDGSLNFQDVSVEYRYGTQDQQYIPGFPSIENEIAANVELKFGVPFIRAISNPDLSAIGVRLYTPALRQINPENGDTKGSTIRYAIDIATDGGPFVNVLTHSITGKASSRYPRSHRIDLPESPTGWQIRIRRLTNDSTDSLIENRSFVEALTEIIDAKMRYPNSALAGIKINAEQFPNIPRRGYDVFGRILRVPSNYNTETREYAGIWDGLFKLAWCDNPAWVYMDLITSFRYGLGRYITDQHVNKWALYEIARHCDGMVPDGIGGFEPRYRCGLLYLQTRADAYQVIQDMATMFQGVAYYANSQIHAVADRPSEPDFDYHNGNVIGGLFTYSASGGKKRPTVAYVSWNDPSDFYRAKVEPVIDREGVARYGVVPIDVVAVGATTRGQAQRNGLWTLLSGRLNTDTVTFTVGLAGAYAVPGLIVRISDAKRAGKRLGGRVAAATLSTVTLDALPTPDPVAGDKLSVLLPSGVPQTRVIQSVNINAKTITVAAPFDSVPLAGGAWAIETVTVVPTLYKILGATDGEKSNTFVVTALKYDPNKFAMIDGGVIVETPPSTQMPANFQLAPTNIRMSKVERAGQVVASTVLRIEWDTAISATKYGVAWRRDNGEWNNLPLTSGQAVDIESAFAGTYIAQVWAYNAAGVQSGRATSEPFTLTDQTMVPGFVGDIEVSLEELTQQQVEQQTELDAEKLERAQKDLEYAAAAALDAQARANAALAAATVKVDALAAEIAEIVNAPPWNETEDYIAGWLVIEDGYLYRAYSANTNKRPSTNPTIWQNIGQFASQFDAISYAIDLATTTATEVEAIATTLNAVVARMPTGTGGLATSAMVAQEATARATAVSAQADRIDALMARMPAGNGTLATAQSVSNVATSVQNLDGVVTGLATRTDVLETKVPADGGRAASVANVTAASQAASDATSAQASRIDSVQASLGEAVRIPNGSFEQGAASWGASIAVGSALPLGVTVDTFAANAYSGSKYLRFAGNVGPADTAVYNQNQFAVNPNQPFRARVRTRTAGGGIPAGATVRLGFRFVDGTGSGVGNQYISFITSTGASWNYDTGTIDNIYVPPATAVAANCILYVSGLTANSVIFDAVEIEVPNPAVDAMSGVVNATAATVVQQQGVIDASAQSIVGLQASAGTASSQISQLFEVNASSAAAPDLRNPSFETDTGWGIQPGGGGGLGPAYYYTHSLALSGSRTMRMDDNNVLFNAGRTSVKARERFRVTAKARTIGSALQASGTQLRVGIRTFNEVGGALSLYLVAAVNVGGAFNYVTVTGIFEVPEQVGAAAIGMYIQMTGRTEGSIMWDDITLERISQAEETAMARHTVALDVNGNMSGTINENDGQTSRFAIIADVFELISSGTVGMEWRRRNGGWFLRAYAAGAQILFGINFGTANNLLMWAGPNVGEANATKANGVFWLDNGGTGYFAGDVLQGTLRAFFSSTTVSASASVSTGSIGTKTKPVAVRGEFTYDRFQAFSGINNFTAGAGATRAVVVLERRYGTGSWTVLVQRTLNGSMTLQNGTDGDASVSWGISGTLSATDVASPSNREYRTRVLSISTQAYTKTGSGSASGAATQNQYQSIESME